MGEPMIERLEKQARAAHNALAERMRESAVREDQLRELLSYCESKAPRDADGVYDAGYYESLYECPAYNDVATKLRKILDGER